MEYQLKIIITRVLILFVFILFLVYGCSINVHVQSEVDKDRYINIRKNDTL